MLVAGRPGMCALSWATRHVRTEMDTLSEVFERFDGRPIPRCPGRYVLRGIDRLQGPTFVVNGRGAVTEHVVAKAQDRVVVTRFEEWGLISYARANGSWLHTANTLEGFRRKLADLGITSNPTQCES